MDAYNTQDVDEPTSLARRRTSAHGPTVAFDPDAEFHWTLVADPGRMGRARMDSYRTRRRRPIVQAEPIVRGRETWSLIPTLCRAAHGHAATRCRCCRPAYAERNDRVRRIYAASDDPRQAWQEARRLGIDYLYVDDDGAYRVSGGQQVRQRARICSRRRSAMPKRSSTPCARSARRFGRAMNQSRAPIFFPSASRARRVADRHFDDPLALRRQPAR